MIDIRFPEMFKNLKQFETLFGLMEIGHTAGLMFNSDKNAK